MAEGASVLDRQYEGLDTYLGSDDGTHRRDIEAKESASNDSDRGDEVGVANLFHHLVGCPRWRGNFRCWSVFVVR